MSPADLRSRLERAPDAVARIARAAAVSRPHLENFKAGRTRLSPEAEARLSAALDALERERQTEMTVREVGQTVTDLLAQGGI